MRRRTRDVRRPRRATPPCPASRPAARPTSRARPAASASTPPRRAPATRPQCCARSAERRTVRELCACAVRANARIPLARVQLRELPEVVRARERRRARAVVPERLHGAPPRPQHTKSARRRLSAQGGLRHWTRRTHRGAVRRGGGGDMASQFALQQLQLAPVRLCSAERPVQHRRPSRRCRRGAWRRRRGWRRSTRRRRARRGARMPRRRRGAEPWMGPARMPCYRARTQGWMGPGPRSSGRRGGGCGPEQGGGPGAPQGQKRRMSVGSAPQDAVQPRSHRGTRSMAPAKQDLTSARSCAGSLCTACCMCCVWAVRRACAHARTWIDVEGGSKSDARGAPHAGLMRPIYDPPSAFVTVIQLYSEPSEPRIHSALWSILSYITYTCN